MNDPIGRIILTPKRGNLGTARIIHSLPDPAVELFEAPRHIVEHEMLIDGISSIDFEIRFEAGESREEKLEAENQQLRSELDHERQSADKFLRQSNEFRELARDREHEIDQLEADKNALEKLFESARKEAHEQAVDARYHADRAAEANGEIGRLKWARVEDARSAEYWMNMAEDFQDQLRDVAKVIACDRTD